MSFLPYKLKKEQIEVIRHMYTSIIICLRAANSEVSGPIFLKFVLIQALMSALVSCKYENDGDKKKRDEMETPFSQNKAFKGT